MRSEDFGRVNAPARLYSCRMRCAGRRVLKGVSAVSFLLTINFLVAILVRSDAPLLSVSEKSVDLSGQDIERVGQFSVDGVESEKIFNEESQDSHAHRKITSVLLRTERRVALPKAKQTVTSANNDRSPPTTPQTLVRPAFISRSAEVHEAKQLAATQETELNDIFISVKTTGKYHESRIDILLETWVELARPVVRYDILRLLRQ